MNTSLPDLVLLDVGDVLIQLRPLREAFPVQELPQMGESAIEEAILSIRNSDLFHRFECGYTTVGAFCQIVRETFSTQLNDDIITEHYLRLLGPPIDGMQELIAQLNDRHVRVCGLSDTSPIHLKVLLDYPIIRSLERLVTSCETGHRKPAKEAFETALKILSAEAGKTFFVDDRPWNVEGARALGMQAVVFPGVQKLREELGL